MPYHNTTVSNLIFFFVITLFSNGSILAAENQTTNIGAIINDDFRGGKEQKTAIAIAIQQFNSGSKNHKFVIYFKKSNGDPLQATSLAEELIKQENVQLIMGMDSWNEAALVANLGQSFQIPVISSVAAAISPQLSNIRWPFLIQMTNEDISDEIACIVSMVESYNWKRVIVVYEDNMYGGKYRALSLLSEQLHKIDSEIEHHMILPHFSSPVRDETVRDEIAKVLTMKQSRVFIVLKSSLQTANRVFEEANRVGLMGKDSVWILGNCVSNFLDSIDSSVFPFMQGALGIKTFYSDKTPQFLEFRSRFRTTFRSNYPDEDRFDPGINALRAYDSVNTVAKALERLENFDPSNSHFSIKLLEMILSSNFSGLTSQIHFHYGKLLESPTFRIVNIVGKSYKEIGFWSSNSGFFDNLENGTVRSDCSMKQFMVYWPGDLVTRYPKGWAMPTNAKRLKIGVPDGTQFKKFVKVEWIESSNETRYSGFCIEVFEAAVKVLEAKHDYTLPYEFVNHTGLYNELIDEVYRKTYDAAVGDITILANRSRYVDFTQPFMESGLSMIVPVKSKPQRAWMFLKPFTMEMWLSTCGIMLYTMFVVWFMEHQQNPAFKGLWKDQLGTALWFTFSSLFFAQREKITSNYSKMVVTMWLFVVFIITASYTASLTSMLTVQLHEPTVNDMAWIKSKPNLSVGCDPDSFVGKYLTDVLKLKNITNVNDKHEYPDYFRNGSIVAAFLELPYQKVFLKQYCNDYMAVGPNYNLGGLGFVFPKGSPLTADVSEAILTLLEEGKIQKLENEWLNSSQNCSDYVSGVDSGRLSLESFWGIFCVSGLMSTLCLLLFVYRLLRKYFREHEQQNGSSNESRWLNAVRAAQFVSRLSDIQVRQTETRRRVMSGWNGNRGEWESVSPTESPEHIEIGRPTQLEIPMRKLDHIGEDLLSRSC